MPWEGAGLLMVVMNDEWKEIKESVVVGAMTICFVGGKVAPSFI